METGVNAMSGILDDPVPQTWAECKAETDRLFAEIDKLNEQMRRDQVEIDRLKAEFRVLQQEGIRIDADGAERMRRAHAALDRFALQQSQAIIETEKRIHQLEKENLQLRTSKGLPPAPASAENEDN